MAIRRRKKQAEYFFDYTLLFIVLFLLGFGLIMVYSTSSYEASMSASLNYDEAYYLKHQAAATALGLVAMMVVSRIPYHFWEIRPSGVSGFRRVDCAGHDPAGNHGEWRNPVAEPGRFRSARRDRQTVHDSVPRELYLQDGKGDTILPGISAGTHGSGADLHHGLADHG